MRDDYCPLAGEPCQSMCETPCGRSKPLTEEQIDFIASEGHRNAAGGIYASSVYEFVKAIERAHGIRAALSQGGGA